jgi:hypothetical protein
MARGAKQKPPRSGKQKKTAGTRPAAMVPKASV